MLAFSLQYSPADTKALNSRRYAHNGAKSLGPGAGHLHELTPTQDHRGLRGCQKGQQKQSFDVSQSTR